MGDKKVPRQYFQVGWGRSIAFVLRLLCRAAPALIDDGLWDTQGHETRGHALSGPENKSVLGTLACDGFEKRGQFQRLQTPRHGVQDGRLMIAATEKVGLSCRKVATAWS